MPGIELAVKTSAGWSAKGTFTSHKDIRRKEVAMLYGLQEAFEHVKNTYFPGWDKGREWIVVDGSEELSAIRAKGIDGLCIRKTKTIKINMARGYSGDDLCCLLIHEICHCGETYGHDDSWQNAMLEIAKIAEHTGRIKLSEKIKKDVDGGIVMEWHNEYMLVVRMYELVKKCVDELPNITSEELVPKLIEAYGVPKDMPDKWIETCKRQYDHIKKMSMSSDCIHGLKPKECYLCTLDNRLKGVMPKFTTKEGLFHGNPVLEVLVDGQSWGVTYPFDEHFRFGVQKAKLILIFSDLIEQFVETHGKRPNFGTKTSLTDLKYNLNSPCTCSTYPQFTLSKGRDIDSPYMQLRSFNLAIGFGLIKAEALIDVRGNIEQFVDKYN